MFFLRVISVSCAICSDRSLLNSPLSSPILRSKRYSIEIVSIIISPIFPSARVLSFSRSFFCSSKVVGVRNMMRSRISVWFFESCFSLSTLNPPSVSM